MSALRQGFRIIEAVTRAGRAGLPFNAIVDQTGVPKASAHRVLKQLVELSALTFDSSSRRYHGGVLLARLGSAVEADYDVRTAARPFLNALHQETGHVSTLGVRTGDMGIYVDKIEPDDFKLRLHSEVGKEFPLHCTAMGKVLLAWADTATRRRLTSRQLQGYTDNTITSGAALRRELRRIREQGFALDAEEITRGLMCVAAPIFDADGTVAAAMSCTFPSYVREDRDVQFEIDCVCRQAALASAGQVGSQN